MTRFGLWSHKRLVKWVPGLSWPIPKSNGITFSRQDVYFIAENVTWFKLMQKLIMAGTFGSVFIITNKYGTGVIWIVNKQLHPKAYPLTPSVDSVNGCKVHVLCFHLRLLQGMWGCYRGLPRDHLWGLDHYNDVIMGTMTSQITSLCWDCIVTSFTQIEVQVEAIHCGEKIELNIIGKL